MNRLNIKKLVASVLIAGQIFPALAAPVIQRTYDADLIAQARQDVDNGNPDTETEVLSPVDAGDPSGLHLSVSELTFPPAPLGQVSAIQRISIRNKTEALEIVSSVSVAGRGFKLASSCANVALTPSNGSCDVLVYAQLESAGPAEGRITFTTQSGQKLVAKLSGSATAPQLVASPAGLSLARYVGEAAETTTVELSNQGGQFIVVGAMSIRGSTANQLVASENFCTGVTLEPGQFCTFQVKSLFPAVGSASSEVLIPDVNNASNLMIYPILNQIVSEEGLACAPNCDSDETPIDSGDGFGDDTRLVVTPPSTTYPAQLVGSQIEPLSVTLLNDGDKAFEITSVFPLSNSGLTADKTCENRRLAPGESCIVTISGVVTEEGLNNIRVVVKRSGSDEQLASILNVEGLQATLSTPEVDFGISQLGEAVAPRSALLANTGSAPLTIGNIEQTSGRFSLTSDGCSGATLPAGGTCQVSVGFSPDVAANYLNFFKVPSSIGELNIVAKGDVYKDRIEAANKLSFDNVGVGATSAAKTITFTNIATQPSTIDSIAVEGTNFALVNNRCNGKTLNAGSSCTVGVTFSATEVGTVFGNVSAVSGGKSITSTPLDGTSPQPVLTALPEVREAGTMPFGQVINGSFVLQNNSLNTAVIEGALISSQPTYFTVSGCENLTLAPGQSCSATYTFTAPDSANAGVLVNAKLAGAFQAVEVFRFIAQPDANGVQATPNVYEFPKLISSSASQTFVLSKFGPLSQAVTSINLSQAQGSTAFAITANTCANANLDLGDCSITVTATAGASTVERTASLNIGLTNDPVLVISMSLPEVKREFTAVEGEAPLEPVLSGSTVNGVLAFRNTGDVPLAATSVVRDGADIFVISNTCTATIAVGATCTVNYRFLTQATDPRTYSGFIRANYTDNKGLSKFAASFKTVDTLSPDLVVSPTKLDFPTVIARPFSLSTSINVPQVVTVTHANTSELSTAALTAPTVPFGYYLAGNTCPSSLARGSSCTYSVQFIRTEQAELYQGNFQVKPTNGAITNVAVSTDVLPELTSVAPGEINNQAQNAITVKGSGFSIGTSYFVLGANDVPATGVTRVDNNTLRATLPAAGINFVGNYDLKVGVVGRPANVLGGGLNYQPPTEGVEWAVKSINLTNVRLGGSTATNASGQIVTCGLADTSGTSGVVVMRNLDINGDSWETVLVPGARTCSNVVANPNNLNHLVVLTGTNTNYAFPAGAITAWRSFDGGTTWASSSVGSTSSASPLRTDTSLNFFNGQFVFGPYSTDSFNGVAGYLNTSSDGASWVRYGVPRFDSVSLMSTSITNVVNGGILHHFYERFQSISTISPNANPFETTASFTRDNNAYFASTVDTGLELLGRMRANNIVKLLATPGTPHLIMNQSSATFPGSVMLADLSKTYSTGTPGKSVLSNRQGLPGRPETSDMQIRDLVYVPSQGVAYVMLSKGIAPAELYVYKTANGIDYFRASPYPASAQTRVSSVNEVGRLMAGTNGQVWISTTGKILHPVQ